MKHILRHIKSSKGSKISSEQAGLARIIFYLILLITVSTDYLVRFSNIEITSTDCSSTMGVWYNFYLSVESAEIIAWIFKISVVAAIIGILTPVALWLSFLSFFILNLNALKYCYFNHLYMPLHISLFLWALLDQNSAFRVDYFFRKKTNSGSSDFLFYCMKAHFCIVFALSGIAKIRNGGLNWMTDESMKNILLLQNYFYEYHWAHLTFSKLNYFITQFPILCSFIAIDSVLVELLSPLILFQYRWVKWIVPQLLLMQIGIYVLMYINFSPWLAIYVFWLWPQKPLLELKTIPKLKL